MFRFRPLHIFLLFFEFVFLNVVIPAHTRGSITIDCPECRTVAVCPYCKSAPHSQPTPEQQQHCAICNFAMHLMLPPVIDYRPAALRLAELLPVAQPVTFKIFAIPTPYHGRAPPAVG
jgi:hypothetical protein